MLVLFQVVIAIWWLYIPYLVHIELDYFALHIPAHQTLSEPDIYHTRTHLAGQPPLPFPIFRRV